MNIEETIKEISNMPLDEKVEHINKIREALHEISPFKTEPVDFVKWVKVDSVTANDYNPNSVAPPEMELLRHSINNDGYTQPVVTWDSEKGREVVDGFHRTRVCKEMDDIQKRVHSYLPVVSIKTENQSRNDRMASTIRHNRARGKHNVTAMSDIVMELKNRNWKNSRIAKELGMDEDEVLRLCQITGLEELFKDEQFSKSWEIGSVDDEYQYLDENFDSDEDDYGKTVNTSDPDRIFHTYDKWECAKAGFYDTVAPDLSKAEAEKKYYDVLTDDNLFRKGLDGVINNWKNSCEHYLTNSAMNRIAWLGQAAVCYLTGVPSTFSRGWFALSKEQQSKANETANEYLNKWRANNNMDSIELEEALSDGRQVNIY